MASSGTPVGGHVYGPPGRKRFGGPQLKVTVLIDGGHLRALALQQNLRFNPDLVELMAHRAVRPEERLLRILYYDCPPFVGTVRLPVSGKEKEINGSDTWQKDLARRELFALRLGVLKFRGFKPRSTPVADRDLTDDDFKPDFEQKGVDMRIGLDIANLANKRIVDRIILMTGDTDCIPAMKHARIEGLQVALVTFGTHRIAPELLWHADYERRIAWPTEAPAGG